MKVPEVDVELAIMPTDFTAKADKIIKELDESVLNISDKDTYKAIPLKNGGFIQEKRYTYRNEVKPAVTPTMVGCRLNRLFFSFMPIEEPTSVAPQQYMQACVEFMRIMEHINNFVIMNANKQMYCLFTGIGVEDYNTLMGHKLYSSTFKRITDAFSGLDFTGAESGLLDSRTTISKMQAKDMGFSMKKAEETPVFITNNTIDKAVIAADLDRYEKLLAASSGKKGKK